jgi:hypothetical protein
MRGTSRTGGQDGQSLVVVIIFLTVLLGFTAVAVDAGRFVSERRFLQNVADAAALAGATALTQGRSHDEAEAIVRETISLNYQTEPTGNAADMPPMVPIYEAGHEGDGDHLAEGILITGGHVRVALRNRVDYTFGKAVGLANAWISARARAGNLAGLLPIAVREYIGLPGPNAGAAQPCTGGGLQFMAAFATAETSCLGSTTDHDGRESPSSGAAFSSADPDNDRDHHGPIVEILGQGAEPDNGADFRGFVALDIRNYATTTSQQFFNGVTSGTSENHLKGFESYWIRSGGYPGPMFPDIAYPPDPNDQVAIMSGNSAGIAVDAMGERYAPGDEVLILVYPGITMMIPEFALGTMPQIWLPATGTTPFAGSFKVSRNQSFTGVVDLSTLPDTLDPANPMVLGTLGAGEGQPITYDPDPVSPGMGQGTSVSLRDITTSGATPGVYALWVKGQAGEPYLQSEYRPLSVRIGSVTRQFSFFADASGKVAVNAGDTVTFTLTLQDWPSRNTSFGGPVTLSVDPPLPGGSVSLGSTTVTPSRNGTTTTLTVNTIGMASGQYRYTVRATGMNGDSPSRKVTMLLPLTVNVAPSSSPGDDDYLDMSGFAVMRITSIDSNTVSAYAITPVIKEMGDSRLKLGKTARLLPW